MMTQNRRENMKIAVMTEPHARVVGNEYGFTGNNVKEFPMIPSRRTILNYLKDADVYDSRAMVFEGGFSFTNDFSIKYRLNQVDTILDLVNGTRLKRDLDERGYAFLRSNEDIPKEFRFPDKFNDDKNKNLIFKTDRVIQDLVYQKLPETFKGIFKDGTTARHLKTQESVDLMGSNEDFIIMMGKYTINNLEILQTLDEQKSVSYKRQEGGLVLVETLGNLTPIEVSSAWSSWRSGDNCPVVSSISPLSLDNHGVAALKRVSPTEEQPETDQGKL